jgi:hypothetical protein
VQQERKYDLSHGKKIINEFLLSTAQNHYASMHCYVFSSCLNITVTASECYLLYYYIFCAVAADSHPKSDGISL